MNRQQLESELASAKLEAATMRGLYYKTLCDLRSAHRGLERLARKIVRMNRESQLFRIGEVRNGNGKNQNHKLQLPVGVSRHSLRQEHESPQLHGQVE